MVTILERHGGILYKNFLSAVSVQLNHFPGLLPFQDTFNTHSSTMGSQFTTDEQKSVLSFPGLTIGEFRSVGM